MTAGHEDETSSREQLSALVDGELDAAAVTRACAAWRDSKASRSTWHAYQLIGDVLRSDDLASSPAQDETFLQALRGRLAAEPVVFAPQAAAVVVQGEAMARTANAGRSSRWSWMAPSAVAAGFVVVAGAVMVTRLPPSDPTGITASARAGQVQPVSAVGSARAVAPVLPMVAEAGAAEPPMQTASATVLRDARLDRYLAAHKQFNGSSALGVPSAFLRAATTDGANR